MKLDDGLLYLIVYGPGRGESVVLRAPPDTWVVVDGCAVGGRSLPAALLDEHNASWAGVVLSHPHQDHAVGLVDVLERPGHGFVACAEPAVEDWKRWALSNDPERRLKSGVVEDVLAAIQTRWSDDETTVWHVRRGQQQTIGDLRVRALHPTDESMLSAGKKINRKSIALDVAWHGVRLVLGGDVESGDWEDIAQTYSDLAKHHGLSVPHHGSKGAVCAEWGGGERNRLWVMTPYNSSKIPRFDDGHGMDWALQRVDSVHLTGLPVRHALQAKVPFQATRQALRDGAPPMSVVAALPGGLTLHEQPSTSASGEPCYVAAGFDEEGVLQDIQHGPGSVVVRDGAASTAY